MNSEGRKTEVILTDTRAPYILECLLLDQKHSVLQSAMWNYETKVIRIKDLRVSEIWSIASTECVSELGSEGHFWTQGIKVNRGMEKIT
jgi:hypothetical protein